MNQGADARTRLNKFIHNVINKRTSSRQCEVFTRYILYHSHRDKDKSEFGTPAIEICIEASEMQSA